MTKSIFQAFIVVGVIILLIANFTPITYEFMLWWYTIGFVVYLVYANMRMPSYRIMTPARYFDVMRTMVLTMSIWPIVLLVLIVSGRNKDKDNFED